MPSDPLAAVWRVILRDQSGGIMDELDTWISLDARRVFNGVGAFQVEISSDGVNAQLIQKTCGIIITRNDVVVFSGQILSEFARTAGTIRFAGLCDNYLLLRPALPDPLTVNPATAYNVVTGQASAVMRLLAFNNLSAPFARADRIVDNLLIAADPALGGTLTGRGGGQPLLALLQEIAATSIAGGLGFQIVQGAPPSSNRVLTIYQPTDRSADVKFGVHLGTASDFEDVQSAPEANAWYVMLGDGLGNDGRTFLYDKDDASIAEWGLLEKLYDARSISDTGEGEQKLAELLAGATTSRKTTVVPFEIQSQQFVDHWNLGDLVTFEAVGANNTVEAYVDLIREVRITHDQQRGWVVTPTIGEAGATNDSLTAQYIASVQDRLSNIERNWTVPDLSIIPAMLTDNAVIARTIAANAVTEPKLDVIDTPANREVLGYDTATGRMLWLSAQEIASAGSFVNLTVVGNTVLGTNATNSLLVNGFSVFAAPVTAQTNVTIQSGPSSVLALFDVSNQRAIIGGSLPLASAGDDKFTVLGGVSYFAGNSGPAIGLRYNAAQTVGWRIGVDAAGANPYLGFFDDSGSEVVTLGDVSSPLQFQVTGSAGITGTASVSGAFAANKAVLNGVSFVGSEILRVVSGSSRFEGSVTVTTGGLGVTGSSVFNSGLSILNGLTVTTGGIDVTGTSFVRSSLTGTSGTFDWQNGGNSRAKFDSVGVGFFGSSPVARQTVVGSRAANAALQSLCSALANLGLISDLTT